MEQVFIDAGTTWSKILKIKNNEKKYEIIETKKLKTLNLDCNKCTGHSLEKKKGIWENEIIALANGAKKYLEKDSIVLDLGSRDIKFVQFQNKKFKDMDWNTSCASATGATIEMLLKFYDVKISELQFTKEKYTITCGIFGLEKIMDDVAKGLDAKIAISKFIHGIAFNAFGFAKSPKQLYISGGFCENPCFIESLQHYCDVTSLGRFVLADGLAQMFFENN